MRAVVLFALFFVANLAEAFAAPDSTNSASTSRVLVVDKCSTTVSGARATLTIGALRPAQSLYEGDYSITVSPYFFKNQKGKLGVVISAESIAKAAEGKVVHITGTATENGKNGKTRRIEAIATPADSNCGMLKLSFMAGGQQLVFDTKYRFVERP